MRGAALSATLLVWIAHPSAADVLRYPHFHHGCQGITLDDVEFAIRHARTCAVAAEIHRICTAREMYTSSRELASALEDRCQQDFDGKLGAAPKAGYDRLLAECAKGLVTSQGRSTHIADVLEAKCRARHAVAQSRRYWQSAPYD